MSHNFSKGHSIKTVENPTFNHSTVSIENEGDINSLNNDADADESMASLSHKILDNLSRHDFLNMEASFDDEDDSADEAPEISQGIQAPILPVHRSSKI